MKKRFGKLSKAEQEEIELEYHQTNPDEFDEQMSKGKKHVADSIRLPGEMVETLKVMAESEGERAIKRWSENGSKNACIKKPGGRQAAQEGLQTSRPVLPRQYHAGS